MTPRSGATSRRPRGGASIVWRVVPFAPIVTSEGRPERGDPRPRDPDRVDETPRTNPPLWRSSPNEPNASSKRLRAGACGRRVRFVGPSRRRVGLPNGPALPRRRRRTKPMPVARGFVPDRSPAPVHRTNSARCRAERSQSACDGAPARRTNPARPGAERSQHAFRGVMFRDVHRSARRTAPRTNPTGFVSRPAAEPRTSGGRLPDRTRAKKRAEQSARVHRAPRPWFPRTNPAPGGRGPAG
jgi:hypothetical protein